MVVLDRTGSMCDVANSDGTCRDETNAIKGIETFLGFMDPKLDEVGLAVFPPAIDSGSACKQPTAGGKNYGYGSWWPSWANIPKGETPNLYAVASPDFDYLIQGTDGWELNPQSWLVQVLGCIKPAGTTSYVDAIDEAQHELDVHGRGNVQDVVILLTDGAANVSPRILPNYVPQSHTPRHPSRAPREWTPRTTSSRRGRSSTPSATTSTPTRTAASAATKASTPAGRCSRWRASQTTITSSQIQVS